MTAPQTFAGKVALVTGASSGMGAECVRMLTQRGAHTLAVDIDERGAAALAAEAGPAVRAFTADVSDAQQCQTMVAEATATFGGLDVAINAAGILGSSSAPLAETSLEDWARVLGVNLNGIFFSMRAQIPAMLSGHGGAIVNFCSTMGVVGTVRASPYVAAKHGVLGLTRAAALEYAASGIRVNAVGPAVVDTPIVAPHLDTAEKVAAMGAKHPIGRIGQPAEIAEMVAFLASDAASFCTGGWYAVDGGWTAQ